MESLKYFDKLIKDTATTYHGGDFSKVFVGGFSQGCIMSFLIALNFVGMLGGILGYSGLIVPIYKILSTPLISEKVLKVPLF